MKKASNGIQEFKILFLYGQKVSKILTAAPGGPPGIPPALDLPTLRGISINAMSGICEIFWVMLLKAFQVWASMALVKLKISPGLVPHNLSDCDGRWGCLPFRITIEKSYSYIRSHAGR